MMKFKIKKGCTRIVFIFSKFIIKIPNFLYSHNHFLKGCVANWSERDYSKKFKHLPEFYNLIAPSYFCSWFGLIQIQAKCTPKIEDLTKKEKLIYFDLCGTDNKKENFGWYKRRLVCLDYGD